MAGYYFTGRLIKLKTFVQLLLISTIILNVLNGVIADKSEFRDKGKICIGTNGRMSVPSNREHHYRNLRERYTNCTYVDGNLELTWLQDEQMDLSFLSKIREVTGHVLISQVNVKRIVLPKLQIIRGRTLFKLNTHEIEFALMVTLSKMHTLEMPSLRDILAGSVGFINNYNLCHIRTINWDEILTATNSTSMYVYNFTAAERECPSCDPSCEAGCWGEGPHNCQNFSKIFCSPQCYQGRCFGKKPRECCHLFCAGGCTGPTQSDCIACRNFYDNGVCTQECPAMQRYNPTTYSWEPNPDGKYAYGATCVKNCPEHLLKDNGACVRSCPPKKKAVNGECVPCNGPCPKTCLFQDNVHSGNIDNFADCTVIEGSLTILEGTFKGYQHFYSNYSFGPHYMPMEPHKLEVFSTLKEVTGFINIQGSHPNFTNLSYFRNLEIIGGRQLTDFAALYIVKSSLKWFGLKSLRKIQSGSVIILENKDLCFAEGIDWMSIKQSSEHKTLLQNNKDELECKKEGLVCDKECSNKGCWGPGSDQCLSCKNYQLDNKCLHDCDIIPGLYRATLKECKPCDKECLSTCRGAGPGNCTRCRNVKDGAYCVPFCPSSKYNESGQCKDCHKNCVYGCTGPENTIGSNGCKSCEKAIINEDVKVERCLQKDEPCPFGYYYEYVRPQEHGPLQPLARKAICRKCHPRCRECTGYGFHEEVCQVCKYYKRGEQCEDECTRDYYADENKICLPCDSECRGCIGPNVNNCLACRNFKLYTGGSIGDNTTTFNCTKICPKIYYPFYPEDGSNPYCSIEPIGLTMNNDHQVRTVTAIGVVAFIIALIVGGAVFHYYRVRTKVTENAVKMSMVLQGFNEPFKRMDEPLRTTNVKPNLAKLRIVKEAELRRGGILGYGAFGTVYKGFYYPEGENVKIPVAIKVLRERTSSNASKQFLEEAYIMASVDHQNLLQLLAVCMTAQMMLVTQLMPLGCLLDYVRNHKESIGSQPLLSWCTQIARGMGYLEEKRLVHRDLAARNVLLQTPRCVKITDFGLAKLLDINEDEYKAEGGKLPIKWLALESIQHRIFTHKSDVWSFGVTIWELFTYGRRPYEDTLAQNVPDLLEEGRRLEQPPICTIEVYMFMLKCWIKDAESRPGFQELAEEFAKMSRDPGRFLVIDGDKFMKLPSYSSQVSHDGKNHGADNEDYLKKKRISCSSTSSPTVSCPLPPIIPDSSSGTGPQSINSWDQFLTNDGKRYCSDPLSNRDNDFIVDDTINKYNSGAKVGNLRLDLPLDDDDYLMPSPQHSQATTAYMDLIGDSKLPNETTDSKTRNYQPDFLHNHILSTHTDIAPMVDNPEYLLGSNIPPMQQLTNHSISPTSTYATQKYSEEESDDHEYYNDVTKRELQPLRNHNTETTV